MFHWAPPAERGAFNSLAPNPQPPAPSGSRRATDLCSGNRLVLVNLLPLVVVFRRNRPPDPRDGLRSFFRLEPQKQLLLPRRLLLLAQSPIAEHHRVVHLQVFRIHRADPHQHVERLGVLALQKQDARGLVQHHTVARIHGSRRLERLERLVVLALRLLDHRLEEPRAAEVRVDSHRLLDKRARGFGLAFLNQRARHVHPAVGVFRLGLGDFAEGVLRALQIALQQQPDAPVVPALAVLFPHDGLPGGLPERHGGGGMRQSDDRQSRGSGRGSGRRRFPAAHRKQTRDCRTKP